MRHDDADHVTGTVATDDAIGFNPLPLLRLLHEHAGVVVVIGQVGGIMHGSRELTGDLDLLWDLVIRYLDRADLIRMRRAAGRPKDLRRANELESLAGAG